MNRIITLICKFLSIISQKLGLGNGGTWPGEIALFVCPDILRDLQKNLGKGIILVAGTNGKTTTSLMISQILRSSGDTVVMNDSGANLLNGVVSSLIKQASWSGQIDSDWGVFEVDENSLPLVLVYVKPQIIVLTNLFRDQLDRYGEVDVIAEKWQKALNQLSKDTTVILNSDDPQIAFLGKNVKCATKYFGLTDKKYFLAKKEHATDSIFCLNCGARLLYKGIYYSHLGDWYCNKCGYSKPLPDISRWSSPLPGIYNLYNTLAAVSVGLELGISDSVIKNSIAAVTPAFGRQEIFEVNGKKVKLFLSKNPVGFNQSLRTVIELGACHILLILNDRIPDGRDVSWIWDVDFEMIPHNVSIIVSGDRVYDLAIRMKYAMESQKYKSKHNKTQELFLVQPELKKAIMNALERIQTGDTLYILPTYSAMLEVRKILTGRKIL